MFFLKFFHIILDLLHAHQSVSWLTSLPISDKYGDISSSGWDIFLKFLRDIPGMLVHYFQIILNFLYVCWSVCWLTSLLKLGWYRDISTSGWYIFLEFFGDISGKDSGNVRSGQVRSSQVRLTEVRLVQVSSGQVRSDQVRSGQVRSNQVMSCQVKSGQVSSGLISLGQFRSDQVSSGQFRSVQIRSGQLRSGIFR